MTAKNKRTKTKSSSSSSSSSKAAGSVNNDDVTKTKTVNDATPHLQSQQQPSGVDGALNNNPFSKAQLAAIVFLMVGVSKIREFHSSLKEDDGGATCMTYLTSSETCSHPNFPSLIQVKYYSAISLAVLVTTFIIQLWVSEYYLLKFMSCLTISPLFATILAVAVIGMDNTDSTTQLQTPMAWQLCSTATVLFVIIRPTSISAFPFLPPSIEDRSVVRIKFLSPQAAGLVALLVGTVWELARVYLSGGGGHDGLQNALLVTDTLLPTPARNLVYFWTIDKLAMGILYGFALYHLPPFKQRSILLVVAIIKFYEYTYQLPNLKDPWQDQETVEQMTLGSAVLSAVAWLAPDMSLD